MCCVVWVKAGVLIWAVKHNRLVLKQQFIVGKAGGWKLGISRERALIQRWSASCFWSWLSMSECRISNLGHGFAMRLGNTSVSSKLGTVSPPLRRLGQED